MYSVKGRGVILTTLMITLLVASVLLPLSNAAFAETVPAEMLQEGSKGQQVRELQQRLKDLGFYTQKVDGDFGPATSAALKEFQKANRLSADGIAGPKTMKALNSTDAISKSALAESGKNAADRPLLKSYEPSQPDKYRFLQVSSTGEDVGSLQRRLRELGYYEGTINERFGEFTKAAVEAFQKRNGLWIDGIAGEDTQSLLYGEDALPARD
jgi:peptidoglycan hydrolase-like protein with peptidoglycan-binding domain